MLFNSYTFLFIFLLATLIVFFQIGKYSRPAAALWLFSASLFFMVGGTLFMSAYYLFPSFSIT